ncbi:hypothetical protein FB465_2092 [Kitasatospora atroaurantiaca]|uniref:Uncharacterized protein n=1 Tax=Kitasatospora atroaurantiaca TaxID=285545 RepID=A0A561ENA3_9ACTN|nr:hypothetical protein FB465_2092 [Kitasatospora atroaurantiaca]
MPGSSERWWPCPACEESERFKVAWRDVQFPDFMIGPGGAKEELRRGKVVVARYRCETCRGDGACVWVEP